MAYSPQNNPTSPEFERALQRYKTETDDLIVIQTYDDEQAAQKAAAEMRKFLNSNSDPNTIQINESISDMELEPVFQVVVNRAKFKPTAQHYEVERASAVQSVSEILSIDGMLARVEILMDRLPNPYQGDERDFSIPRLDHELSRTKVIIAALLNQHPDSPNYKKIKSDINSILNKIEKEVQKLRLISPMPDFLLISCNRLSNEIDQARKGHGTTFVQLSSREIEEKAGPELPESEDFAKHEIELQKYHPKSEGSYVEYPSVFLNVAIASQIMEAIPINERYGFISELKRMQRDPSKDKNQIVFKQLEKCLQVLESFYNEINPTAKFFDIVGKIRDEIIEHLEQTIPVGQELPKNLEWIAGILNRIHQIKDDYPEYFPKQVHESSHTPITEEINQEKEEKLKEEDQGIKVDFFDGKSKIIKHKDLIEMSSVFDFPNVRGNVELPFTIEEFELLNSLIKDPNLVGTMNWNINKTLSIRESVFEFGMPKTLLAAIDRRINTYLTNAMMKVQNVEGNTAEAIAANERELDDLLLLLSKANRLQLNFTGHSISPELQKKIISSLPRATFSQP